MFPGHVLMHPFISENLLACTAFCFGHEVGYGMCGHLLTSSLALQLKHKQGHKHFLATWQSVICTFLFFHWQLLDHMTACKVPPPYRFVFWDSAKLKQVLQVFVKYYHCANMIVTKLVRIYIFEMIECSERCFLLWARQTLINEDIASAIEQVFNYLNYSRVGWPFILPFLHLAGGNKRRKQGKGEEKKMFLEVVGEGWGVPLGLNENSCSFSLGVQMSRSSCYFVVCSYCTIQW